MVPSSRSSSSSRIWLADLLSSDFVVSTTGRLYFNKAVAFLERILFQQAKALEAFDLETHDKFMT